MEVKATGKRLRVPPRKARLVAREVKGKHAEQAMAELKYHPSNAAYLIRKVLSSAVGNAVENENMDRDTLVIARIDVDEGWRLKRVRARAQGRMNRILKRTSHITVVLEQGDAFETRKSNAKPKPRPKFDIPKPKKSKKEKVEEPVGETTSEERVADEAAVEETTQKPASEAVAEDTASAPEAETETEVEDEPAAEEGSEEEKKEQE